MAGYLQDDAATEEIRNDDWLTVDDLGFLDDDGYLFLTGRARDMVISGGVNIYPVEIETALLQHPSIEDVAVVGAPDERWGERLVAFVVAKGDVEVEALEVWAKGRLSPYKVPRQWVRVEALPRNPTGKVLKRELVESLV
jgi:long-chain acyl-CoA synthetase